MLLRYSPDGAAVAPTEGTRFLGGVAVPLLADPEGRMAASLGALTSGSAVFMDARGRIRFHGGLTLERGHRGRSPAQDALVSLVLQPETPALGVAPVYGCALPAATSAYKWEICR